MLKSGLVSISFRKYFVKDIIFAAKSAGIDAIEWGSDVHAPCDDIARLNEIADLQKQNGIVCCSYGTYFRIGTDKPKEIKKYISAAKILGTNVLRVWCGSKASKLYSDIEKQELFGEAIQLAQIAKEENATLCLEFHPNTFTDCLESSLQIMKTVNSKNLKMYWQPNQFNNFEQNIIEAKGISEFVENIHVFNWENDERYTLNAAVDTWIKYVKGFKGNHYMLLEFMPDDKIESLKPEFDALIRIINMTC